MLEFDLISLLGTFAVGIIGVILLYLVQSVYNGSINHKKFSHIPSITPHFLFGNIHEAVDKNGGFPRWLEQSFNKLQTDVLVLWAGSIPLVVVRDPESIKHVIQNHAPKSAKSYQTIASIIGESSLLTSQGADWEKKRKLFNPGFRVEFMRNITPTIVARSLVLMDSFAKAAQENKPVDIHSEMVNVTLDIIGLVGFEHDFGFTTGKSSEATRNAIATVMQEGSQRVVNPWRRYTHFFSNLKFERALKSFHDLGREIIKKSRESPVALEEDRSIFSLLKRAAETDVEARLTDDQLLDEISTFLLAGHETTAATLSLALMLLCLHPEAKAKVEEEVKSALGSRNFITYDQASDLRYCTMVIKESLRLYPVASQFPRMFPHDEVLPNGAFVPANTTMLLSVYCVHRHPRVWPDPHAFKPERFEDADALIPFSWIPFSNGPRNCIGQPLAYLETRILMALIVQKFDFELVEKDIDPEKFLVALTLRPPRYHLRLKLRKYD